MYPFHTIGRAPHLLIVNPTWKETSTMVRETINDIRKPYFKWGPGIEILNIYNDDEEEEHKQNTDNTNPPNTIDIEET